MLDIQRLHVVFGAGRLRVDAVKGVSFRVEPGGSFGLVGESGSGKSTVLRAVCGLAPVTSGSIAVDGRRVPTPRDKAFYRTVQMVFQDPYASLHPRYTVDRTLAEPLAIHGEKDGDVRILQALREVGLGPSFRFRFPH
jgi:peptide/nickel transport system ATP-binding protein